MPSPFAPNASVNAQAGRNTTLSVGTLAYESPPNYSTVAGLRTNSLQLNDPSVDFTNSLSNGNMELLADGGVSSLKLSLAGVYNTNTTAFATLEAARQQKVVVQAKIEFTGTGLAYEGWFVVQDFQIDSPYDNIQTFTTTLASTGTLAYTPAT